MALSIRKPALDVPHRKGKVKKEPDYLAALHLLPCVVTGRMPVEAAHISFAMPEYGHWGRAKGTKAHDRWALPLTPEEHRRQHNMNERMFWLQVGINPHVLALTLWGIWTEYGDFERRATAVIRERMW